MLEGEDPFLPVCFSSHPSCCGSTIPSHRLSMVLSQCVSVSFHASSSYKDTRHTGLKTHSAPVTSYWIDITTAVTLFQIKSHPGAGELEPQPQLYLYFGGRVYIVFWGEYFCL